MQNIDYFTRCDCVVNERYDPECYDLYGDCMCKACREWALRKDQEPDKEELGGSSCGLAPFIELTHANGRGAILWRLLS
jgi:hypothetical protein